MDEGFWSDRRGLARRRGMKTKKSSARARRLTQADADEIDRDIANCFMMNEAVGAANKWLRASLSEARGHHVGERDVALLLRRVDDPRPGREWIAVFYTAEEPEAGRSRLTTTSPEWAGTHWRAALTSAVFDLLSRRVMGMVERRSDTSWFMFEDIHGSEIVP